MGAAPARVAGAGPVGHLGFAARVDGDSVRVLVADPLGGIRLLVGPAHESAVLLGVSWMRRVLPGSL